jgi:hypothetical protein
VNGNSISNNSTVAVSPGDVCVIGVSIRNDGTAASGNVRLHLQIVSNSTPASFDIVKSDDIVLGIIQNDSTCIDTPSAYQVNVSSSANAWDGIVLWISIYEGGAYKKTFSLCLSVR